MEIIEVINLNNPRNLFQLQDILSLDMIKNIIFELGTITGLRVSLANYKGELYEETENPNTLNSCTAIRNSGIGHLCEKSDAFAGLEAARLGEPIVYLCHMGAAETASPIIVNGQYLGCLLAGQAKLPDHETAQLERIVKSADISKLPSEEQAAYINHDNLLRPYTLEKLQAMSRLLFVMANYIAELSYKKIIQKQIDEYEFSLLRERNLNVELERNLAMVHLKNVQSRMNPHFLFNALNTINQQSILEGAEKTAGLIEALSDILRKTVKNSNQVGTLNDELTYIKSYLHIMKVALQDRLNVVFDVDETFLDAQLPILTIQPIVENAIIHGIEPKPEGGNLTISIKRVSGWIDIVIADTGVGIKPELLIQIRSIENISETNIQETSLGIRSVIRILREHFKSSFRWSVTSVGNEGAKITLRIPYRAMIIDSD